WRREVGIYPAPATAKRRLTAHVAAMPRPGDHAPSRARDMSRISDPSPAARQRGGPAAGANPDEQHIPDGRRMRADPGIGTDRGISAKRSPVRPDLAAHVGHAPR